MSKNIFAAITMTKPTCKAPLSLFLEALETSLGQGYHVGKTQYVVLGAGEFLSSWQRVLARI